MFRKPEGLTFLSLDKRQLRNALNSAGFIYQFQEITLTPEQRTELIKISILPAVGIIVIVIVFLIVRDRLMSQTAKLSGVEMDSLKREMENLAVHKKQERRSQYPGQLGTPTDIKQGDVPDEQEDGNIEGQSLV